MQTLSFMFLKTFVGNKRRGDKVKLMQLEQYMYSENEPDGLARQPQTGEETWMDSTLADDKSFLMPKSTDDIDQEVDFAERHGGWLDNIRAKFMQDVNMMAQRRLTRDLDGKPIGASITPMHKDNIRRLKNAYRHPFQRIPAEYFEFKQNKEQ